MATLVGFANQVNLEGKLSSGLLICVHEVPLFRLATCSMCIVQCGGWFNHSHHNEMAFYIRVSQLTSQSYVPCTIGNTKSATLAENRTVYKQNPKRRSYSLILSGSAENFDFVQ